MKAFRLAAALCLGLALAACNQDKAASVPAPHEPGPDAVGTICRMALSEHGGPKGQVFLRSGDRPLWFSSVRDTFTWLLIEDGNAPSAAAIWVNDMARSKAWDRPDAGAWVQARHAFFVAGSDRGTGMGDAELVPFSDRAMAQDFANKHGGTVLGFSQITREVLAGAAANQGKHRHG
jgi:copper chaperone NosL